MIKMENRSVILSTSTKIVMICLSLFFLCNAQSPTLVQDYISTLPRQYYAFGNNEGVNPITTWSSGSLSITAPGLTMTFDNMPQSIAGIRLNDTSGYPQFDSIFVTQWAQQYCSAAAIVNGSQLWSWGQSNMAGVGSTSGNTATSPPTLISDRSMTIMSIQSSSYTTLVWFADGTLWSYGSNSLSYTLVYTVLSFPISQHHTFNSGLLGLGSSTTWTASPTQLDSSTWGNNPITSITCGEFTCFILTNNNQLYGWGWNFWCNLGMPSVSCTFSATAGDYGYSSVFQPTLISSVSSVIPSGTSILAVYCNYAFAIATLSNNQMIFWGDNTFGEVGQPKGSSICPDTDSNNDFYWCASPVLLPYTNLPAFSKVAIGGYHTLGLTANGTVWGFGDNTAYALASTCTGSCTPGPLTLTGVPSVIADIAATYETSFVVSYDGQLFWWGQNLISPVFASYIPVPTYVPIPLPICYRIQNFADATSSGFLFYFTAYLGDFYPTCPLPGPTGFGCVHGQWVYCQLLQVENNVSIPNPGTVYGGVNVHNNGTLQFTAGENDSAPLLTSTDCANFNNGTLILNLNHNSLTNRNISLVTAACPNGMEAPSNLVIANQPDASTCTTASVSSSTVDNGSGQATLVALVTYEPVSGCTPSDGPGSPAAKSFAKHYTTAVGVSVGVVGAAVVAGVIGSLLWRRHQQMKWKQTRNQGGSVL